MARKRGGSRAASSAVSKRNSAPKPGAKPGATPDRARVIDAFMSLVAEKPMEDIGLAEIASQAGVSLADLRAMFGSTFDILAAHVRQIDVEVLAGADADMAEESPRERLFDVLMRRIELLEPRKDAVRSLMRSCRRNPGLALALNRLAVRSQQWMLTAADIPAITAIYDHAVRHGTASFELEPPDAAEMARRRQALVDGGYPYLVAEADGTVAGYAYVGPYRPRPTFLRMARRVRCARRDLRSSLRRCCASGCKTMIPDMRAPWRRSIARWHVASAGRAFSLISAAFRNT